MATETKVAQHTPGPWAVENWEPTRDLWLIAGNHRICHFDSNEPMAVVDANARLIAAAPELLAALLQLLAPVSRSLAENDAVWGAAREAVRKATGNSR